MPRETANAIVRLPAEWESQDGVLLAWPHPGTDWAPCLDVVEPVFAEIATAVSHFERVLIAGPDPRRIRRTLRRRGADLTWVQTFAIPTNDVWVRDFGPITVQRAGRPRLLDFAFNAWGLKHVADRDNQVTRRLHERGAFGRTPLDTLGLVLEGGSIESDGAGTLLTTAGCLLNPNRNPHLTRRAIECELRMRFGCRRVLWLEHGQLAGDDTDGHVDTLARFAPGNTIVHVVCDDRNDSHYRPLRAMAGELLALRTRGGKPYRLLPLPWPNAVHDENGQRLPATYANFLIINGAVLVPIYRDPHDAAALEVLKNAFPEREIIGIPCLPLIRHHGSLHCVTMQLPAGVLP